jgi:penicillin-binding protein 1B
VRARLGRDYRESDLRGEGLRVFTTLDPAAQAHAEAALAEGIAALERARGLPAGQLQGAAVVTDTDTGEILALVGGRDPRAAGFNRALHAVRPVGSLVKPAVYLAAFGRDGGYTPASVVEDSALRLVDAEGEPWTPRNFDRAEHGPVLLAEALVRSYNLATVRVGLSVGLRKVIHTLGALGLEEDPAPYPSLLLGAVEASPLDMAGLYHTLATGGFRTPLRAIREVTGPDGAGLSRYRLRVVQALEPGPVYLVSDVLTRVLTEGTGRGVTGRLPPGLTLAAKTGTTDDLRDSWLAGFGGSRLAVVWLGRDDNRPAGLTGGSGAGRVWADIMAGVERRSWAPPVPEAVTRAWVNGRGERVAADCPGARQLPFLRDRLPPEGRCAEAPAPVTDDGGGFWIFD